MKRAAPPARKTRLARSRKPISPFGRRRAGNSDKRREVVAAVLARDGYRCQAPHGQMVGLVGCFGPLDCHEVIPRSAWRDGYLDPSNCLTLARSCHDWVGDHPQAAHALRLHAMSWERSA